MEKNPNESQSILTKKCVLKKIKELANWQVSPEKGKMCWHVSKKTQKEFGAEVKVESPEKKPKKCYFWKFIKKGEKTKGTPSPMPHESEIVVLDS